MTCETCVVDGRRVSNRTVLWRLRVWLPRLPWFLCKSQRQQGPSRASFISAISVSKRSEVV